MNLDLRDILTALRGGWWLMLLGSLVGGGAAAGITWLTTPTYTSTTELFISTTDSTSTQAAFTGSQFSQERLASYAELLRGERLAGQVRERLDLGGTPSQLLDQISVEPVPNTVLLNVSVTDPSPAQAQRIAAAIGEQFPQLVSEVESRDAIGRSLVTVTVVEPADLPTAPSSPNPTANLTAGLLAGLLIGAIAAIARVRLDRTVKDPELAAELAGAPVLGVILRDPVLADRHVFDPDQSSPAGEGYRRLRANLQFLQVDEPTKIILVSSAIPGEGKTTLAINLALALVEAGRQVAVVDGDLRRPRVTRYLHLVGGVGVTHVLSGSADLAEVLQQYGSDGFTVVGAGPTPPNPSQLLASGQMGLLVAELAAKNDYVVIDAPPVLPVADATSLAAVADGIVLSVHYGSTRKELVRRAAATLEQVGARTLGVVLNMVPPHAAASEGYGYRYEYQPEK